MSDFDKALQEVKNLLFDEKCVKEYFYYKNIIDKDSTISKLDEQVKFHQKEMCKNKQNSDKYLSEKALYEKYKKEFDNNPILVNYQIAKDEVFSLLVDIKHILG